MFNNPILGSHTTHGCCSSMSREHNTLPFGGLGSYWPGAGFAESILSRKPFVVSLLPLCSIPQLSWENVDIYLQGSISFSAWNTDWLSNLWVENWQKPKPAGATKHEWHISLFSFLLLSKMKWGGGDIEELLTVGWKKSDGLVKAIGCWLSHLSILDNAEKR